MDYIVKNNNVTCMLTTHYVKLCKKLSKNDKIMNYNMKTIKKKNKKLKYTYQIQNGISKIKGGFNVLIDMNYPQEIINNDFYLILWYLFVFFVDFLVSLHIEWDNKIINLIQ